MNQPTKSLRILFTGSSSATGFWAIQALAAAGHTIVATFNRSPEFYDPIRASRAELLSLWADCIYGCPFGSDAFEDVIKTHGPFDVLCHHGAEVSGYRSPDFDAVAAISSGCMGHRQILRILASRGCTAIVTSGSVVEPWEGASSGTEEPTSPFALAKAFTADLFRYHGVREGMHVGHYVIANPYGAYEDPTRFGSYLVRTWLADGVPVVKTPLYVRDNIPLDLHGLDYADFVNSLPTTSGHSKRNPSFQVETNFNFAQRLASNLSPRIGRTCIVEASEQSSFDEPLVCINTERLDTTDLGWNETESWDRTAEVYLEFCR
jgi:UDP-glucose 4-epimerase